MIYNTIPFYIFTKGYKTNKSTYIYIYIYFNFQIVISFELIISSSFYSNTLTTYKFLDFEVYKPLGTFYKHLISAYKLLKINFSQTPFKF